MTENKQVTIQPIAIETAVFKIVGKTPLLIDKMPEDTLKAGKNKKMEEEKIQKQIQQCLICGKKADDNHHTKPKKLGGTHTIPLCKKHHTYIENIKTAILVMEREKKVSIRRFRHIIDEIKNDKEMW